MFFLRQFSEENTHAFWFNKSLLTLTKHNDSRGENKMTDRAGSTSVILADYRRSL